jgi:hypothetical protein
MGLAAWIRPVGKALAPSGMDSPFVVFVAFYPQNVGFILLILPVGAGYIEGRASASCW